MIDLLVVAAKTTDQWYFSRQKVDKSPLTYGLYQTSNGRTVAEQTWRGGSGQNENTCDVGKGWLPGGWYDQWGHWNNYGGKIQGRVFYLSDKQCWNGYWRRELFIHTEETAQQTQQCTSWNPDDPYCWEGAHDHKSEGCIKISPDAMSSMHSLYGQWNAKHNSFVKSRALYVG
jgi:hypothetical protein